MTPRDGKAESQTGHELSDDQFIFHGPRLIDKGKTEEKDRGDQLN
jgi:hypothetical protein